MERHSSRGSTTTMEAIELRPTTAKQDPPNRPNKRVPSTTSHSLRSLAPTTPPRETDQNETLPSPTLATTQPERWNHPRKNLLRVLATFWSFLIMGANDATYGPIIPYLEEYYHLSYLVVSLIFLSPFVGYNVAAILNNTIHLRLGQRGIAFLGPVCHMIAYVVIALHPPYPVLVVVFILAGLGNGLEDSAWNAWIGNMANANEILGFLHAFYGLGATIAPLIATTMITKAGMPWYYWYYIMIGGAVIELATSLYTFWGATAQVFRDEHPRTSDAGGSRLKEAVMKMPAARVVWLSALFLLGYVGIEVALGGWIVTFMIRVRHGAAFASGMAATGFWLGITVGRVVLGFVTPRIGEKLAIAIYLPIALGLQLLFWLVPQFYVSAVAVALQGFFLGPMFPAAMVACTKLLPKHLHVSGIGFAAAFGGSGGAIFPFAVGAIAQAKGVQVLQPIILALVAVIWMLWMCLPKIGKKKDQLISKEHADLVVTCGDCSWNVRKVIVCARSEFFAKACSAKFEEGKIKAVELHDDDRDIINQIIFYIYHGMYKGTDGATHPMHFSVRMVAAAEKYLVDHLASIAFSKLHHWTEEDQQLGNRRRGQRHRGSIHHHD
ncbi:hypothetical protein LTR62_003919 [Meristemomyces frigidus]|uniref:Major facilitator superfamily (MFS) profile domain-containing protein n=1 Tax=Meristemomyces frigidus TaxID=1508187 RepID=A0AAN7TEA2_9PEZI|nr:hypothetical protein LTR62_003919 [Meristemomyces frigidus]